MNFTQFTTNFTSEASEIQENKWNLFPNSTTGELINILLHGYQEQRNRVHYLLPVALTSTSNAVSYSQWYTLHSIIWRQIRCDIAFIALLCNVTVEFGNKFHAHSQRWLAYGTYPCNNGWSTTDQNASSSTWSDRKHNARSSALKEVQFSVQLWMIYHWPEHIIISVVWPETYARSAALKEVQFPVQLWDQPLTIMHHH